MPIQILEVRIEAATPGEAYDMVWSAFHDVEVTVIRTEA